jgi:hypothetical protein
MLFPSVLCTLHAGYPRAKPQVQRASKAQKVGEILAEIIELFADAERVSEEYKAKATGDELAVYNADNELDPDILSVHRKMRDPELNTRRKLQSASHAKQDNEPVSREEAAELKTDVPDTRPKSKLAQVTQTNATQRPTAPPHTTYTNRISVMDSRPSVSVLGGYTYIRRHAELEVNIRKILSSQESEEHTPKCATSDNTC